MRDYTEITDEELNDAMMEDSNMFKESYLPNGKTTTDADLFVEEWHKLCDPLEKIGLILRGFNDSPAGTASFSYKETYGRQMTMPVELIQKIKDFIEKDGENEKH